VSYKVKQLGPIIFVLIIMLLLAGCGKSGGVAEPKRPPVSGVEISVVQSQEVEAVHETVGNVKAANVSVLASKLMGTVLAVHVRQGERVRAGQLLLEIEARDLAAQANAAAAQRQLAQATFARYQRLSESGAISRQDYDVAMTQKNVAEAEYQRIMATMAFARVTAPMDGVVSDRRVDPGTMVAPGQTLLTVDDPSSYVVETNIEERWADKLSVGTPIKVRIPALNQSYTGTVLEISPSIDAVSRTFYAKVSLPGERLRSGLYARIEFSGGRERILLVPTKAIFRKGQLDGVYVVSSEGVVTFRPIKIGRSIAANTEVLSGLNAGDKLIISGLDKAVDGGKLAEGKKP